jgi:hypothetical protein
MPGTTLKLKITKKRIISIVALLAVFVGLLYSLNYYNAHLKPITTLDYKGIPIGFRQDLREAIKVPLYPNDEYLRIGLIHPLVQNITIAFKDVNKTEDPYYSLEGVEIVSKLKVAYGFVNPPTYPNFTAVEVTSYENLPGKIQIPIIALIHPEYANETSVRFDANAHVVYIQGKTHKDFDLATIRFLIAALDIQVPN